MKNRNNRMRLRQTTGVKTSLKTITRITVITGCSALLIGAGIFFYLNVSQVESTRAGIAKDRVIMAVQPKNDMEVKALVLLPLEQQPAARNNNGIVNKRRAVLAGQ